uniref:Ig-like domain-containing protein n=1 Tax=Gopherus evgoodei TaxID=1825980 RepID=A0A8C4WLN9_9SAUR
FCTQEPFSIWYFPPENVLVQIEIPCAAYASQSGTARIEWKFEKGSSIALVYYDGKFTDPYKDRAEFTPTGIHFTSVTRKDTGKYICEVLWTRSGGSGQLRKSEVDLIVQGTNVILDISPHVHLPFMLNAGHLILSPCSSYSHGSPPPTCQYYRDNVLMTSNPNVNKKFRNSCYAINTKTGVLMNEPVTSFDMRDYFCEAQNNVGTTQKSEAIHLEASKEIGTCRVCMWVGGCVRTSALGSSEVTCKLTIASAVTGPSLVSCSYSLYWLR